MSRTLVALAIMLVAPAHVIAGIIASNLVVPGTANPYLASPLNSPGGDPHDGTAPIRVSIGNASLLQFSATGITANFPNLGDAGLSPDGRLRNGGPQGSDFGSRGGISGWSMPVNALGGVFLGPTIGGAPSALPFDTTFSSLSPKLGQTFFIGDGLTGTATGSRQTFNVPVGATDVYLYSTDGHQWGNNSGSFAATVSSMPATPAPSWSDLAEMSASVYPAGADAPDVSGYTKLGTNVDFLPAQSTNIGFHGVAYQNDAKDRIVVALRGTTLNSDTLSLLTTLKNTASDQSFVSGTPTLQMRLDVLDAAGFVAEIHNRFPAAEITLTGHSLGGTLAQLVSVAAGVDSTVFDAPGGGDLLQSVAIEVSPVFGLGHGATTTNVRLYGDQFSLVGEPMGRVVTLEPPSELVLVSGSADTAIGRTLEALLNIGTALDLHSITLLADLLDDTYSVAEGAGPNYVPFFESLIRGILRENSIAFAWNVIKAALFLFDPMEGDTFRLVASDSSPRMETLALPGFVGLSYYDVQTREENEWSPIFQVRPGQLITLGDNVTGLAFTSRDASGHFYTLPEGFPFLLTFESDGLFSARLVNQSAVPEPSSLGLVASACVLLLGFRLRYSRSTRVRCTSAA